MSIFLPKRIKNEDCTPKAKSFKSFPKGLKNLGNTCFLNSILQALYSIRSFRMYIKELEILDKSTFIFKIHLLFKEFDEFDSKLKIFDPTELMDKVKEYNPFFEGNYQQDALELFETIISLIDKEKEDFLFKRLKLSSSPQKSINNNSCIPVNPFEGYISRDLQCTSCIKRGLPMNYRPLRLEKFITLPLPISSDNFKQTNSRIANAKGIKKIDFIDCINEYFKPEILLDINCLACSIENTMSKLKKKKKILENSNISQKSTSLVSSAINFLSESYPITLNDLYFPDVDSIKDIFSNAGSLICQNEMTDFEFEVDSSLTQCKEVITKSINLVRLPNILSFYLCRKFFDPTSQNIVKNDSYVNVPKYLIFDTKKGFRATSLSSSFNSEFLFVLRSVIVHIGGSNFGHYITYCSSIEGEKVVWFLVSDELVKKVSEKEVLSSQASILFYENKT